MGIYLNPGNEGFKGIRNGEYIDKSMMLRFINGTINKKDQKLICSSRPRRFYRRHASQVNRMLQA